MSEMTFEYSDLPNIMAGYKNQFTELSNSVERRMVEKAKIIAKKMNSNCDPQMFSRLTEESKFVQSVAMLIDQSRTMYNFFESAALQTQDDWLAHAVNGKKIKDQLEFLKQTVLVLQKREDQYLEIIKTISKTKRNEQPGS